MMTPSAANAPTTHDLSFACRCGRLSWRATQVEPAVANRITCACAGCRAFAGRMDPDLLDELGGTERLQVDPGSLRFAGQLDQLGCMQQTRGGALRWYARCCGTPIGLTLTSARVPFVGIDTRPLDAGALPVPLDEVIGPIRARVNHTIPRARRRALRADLRALFSMLAHLLPLTWRWWRRGAHHRSPFFDASGGPAAPVEVLFEQQPSLAQTMGCR